MNIKKTTVYTVGIVIFDLLKNYRLLEGGHAVVMVVVVMVAEEGVYGQYSKLRRKVLKKYIKKC